MTIKKITCFCLLALLFFCPAVMAQQKFSNGKVTYTVEVDLPSGVPPQAADAFKNSSMVFNFRNYLFRYQMHLGKITYTNIRNIRDHSAVMLINSGTKKYLIKLNEAELKKEAAKYEGITFQEQSGTKEIAGYTCHKALGKLENGNTFTVYYTPELQPAYANYSPRFKGLKGLPLKYEISTKNNVKMTMTATDVVIGPQPASLFDTPTTGYRELSYEEFESLKNSK